MNKIIEINTKIFKLVFDKQVLLVLTSICVFILFKSPIEIFLSNTIIEYVLKHIQSTYLNDTIFCIALFAIIIYVIYKRSIRFIPSCNFIILVGLVCISYLYYRLSNTIWTFQSFKSITFLKYSDLVLFQFAGHLFLLVRKTTKHKVLEGVPFLDDQSVGDVNIDELGYTSYAESLANKLLSSNFNRSFSVGVNGKWGLGKTSFIDLLKRKLKRDDIIEVNFNPWNSHSTQSVITDFFETVQDSIRPYDSSLSRLLIQYSNKLVSLNDNSVTNVIQSFIYAITGFESTSNLYKVINESLIKVNKKLIVYIDDLDRLDKDEIMEIIKLVRNTANFHNTVFVVAYDRDYVIKAIGQHNTYKNEKFLEKIFQIEITLPNFNKKILKQKFFDKITGFLTESFHSEIHEFLFGSIKYREPIFNNWIQNIRDVNRLINSIVLNIDSISSEVDIIDFIRLEMLRVFYPSAYELLYKNTADFLEVDSSDIRGNYYRMIGPDKTENEIFKQARNKYEKFLYENKEQLSIPEIEVRKIGDLVGQIFDKSYISRSHLSVTVPSRFNLYFSYSLWKINLSELKFTKARNTSLDEFKDEIINWVNAGVELELKWRLEEIRDFNNREDFEKIISAIFYLANLQTKITNSPFSLVLFSKENLYSKLSNYNDGLIKKYYTGVDGGNKLKQFILNIFENAQPPFSIESSFIRYINDQITEEFPLNKFELRKISVSYLEKYCNSIEEIDGIVWDLFDKTKETFWTEVSPKSNSYTKSEIIPIEAKHLLRDFCINKDLDGFLLAIIKRDSRNNKTYAISKLVLEIFDSWDNFKEAIFAIEEGSSFYLNEFKKFYDIFQSKNHELYVSFSFIDIPINKNF
jgi:KAP family P-loop domain